MYYKQVDRDVNYMYEMWGTTRLITDYWSLPQQSNDPEEFTTEELEKQQHNLKKQSELHQKIRNDDDYDDWSYGTEPNYGVSW